MVVGRGSHRAGSETARPRARSPAAPRRRWHARRVLGRTGSAFARGGLLPGSWCWSRRAANRSPASGRAGAAAGRPRLDRFYAQQLTWGPCADVRRRHRGPRRRSPTRRSSAPGWRCRWTTPHPDGPTAPDRGAAPAGHRGADRLAGDEPGRARGVRDGAGRRRCRAGWPTARCAERFDLVGFDPRGRRGQHADDRLPGRRGAGRPSAPTSTSTRRRPGVAQTEAENQAATPQRCAERSGGATCWPTSAPGTWSRDLDILRAALGDEKLTYLGYSYGTRIGSAYAEAFPQQVRALVLDGALDPTQSTVDQNVDAGRRVPAGLRRVRRRLRAAPQLPARHRPGPGHRGLPGAGPPADRRAGAGRRRPRGCPTPTRITGVNQALYLQSFWPVLARGLAALADRRRDDPARAGRPVLPDRGAGRAATATLHRGVRRHQLRRRAARSPTAAAQAELARRAERGGAVPRRRPRPGRRARRLRVLAGAADRASRTCRGATGCRRRWSSRPPATRPRRTRPGSTWPRRCGGRAGDRRGQPAHRGAAGQWPCVDDAVARYLVDLHAAADRGARCTRADRR